VYGIPEIEAVVKKWDDEYLSKHLKRDRAVSLKVEKSEDNHFMYNVRRKYSGDLGSWDPKVKE
jgi:hypothetical protein